MTLLPYSIAIALKWVLGLQNIMNQHNTFIYFVYCGNTCTDKPFAGSQGGNDIFFSNCY